MSIPKYDDLIIPALVVINDLGTARTKDLVTPLGLKFGLSNEEITKTYPRSKDLVFKDRISWALSYLNMAGLVHKPKRGTYQLNETAKTLLLTPVKIRHYIDSKLVERQKKIQNQSVNGSSDNVITSDTDFTPNEQLYASYFEIRKTIYDEILDTIVSKSPIAFEQLVIELLQKMGYGGEISEAASLTKTTGDGGIDGVIKEDILGLGRIHIQAKRYKAENSVGRPEIQAFVGALAVAQSNKGVFITTSSFTKSAIEYANSLNGLTTVILIDGQKLAGFIYDFGLGMQVEKTLEIKKLDSDYWDNMGELV